MSNPAEGASNPADTRFGRLVAFACFATIALLLVFPLMDFDLHWHLANGKAMVEQHRIVNEEIFSFTREGAHFDNLQWLGQVILYLAHSAGGDTGLIIFKVALLLMACCFVYRAALDSGSQPAVAAILILAAVMAGLHRYVARTELFSFLFLGLLMYLISGARSGRLGRRVLYLLPLIMVIWSRSHLSVYGFILIASMLASETVLYLIDRRGYDAAGFLRALWIAFIVTTCVLAIDPYGLRAYISATNVTSGPGLMIYVVEEFRPPRLDEFHLFWAMLAASAILPVALRRDRKSLALAIVVLPFALLSLRYNRTIAFFALVSVPLLAHSLGTAVSRIKRLSSGDVIYKAIIAIAFLIALGYAADIKLNRPGSPYEFGLGLNEDRLPAGAVRFMQDAGVQGHVFNRGFYGGYLAYTMYPQKRIFIYNLPSVFDSVLIKTQSKAFLDEYSITHALVNYDDFWSRALLEEGKWTPVYWRSNMALYLRNSVPDNAPLIDRYGLLVLRPGTGRELMAMALSHGSPYMKRAMREAVQLLAYGRDDALASMLSAAMNAPGALSDVDQHALDMALSRNPRLTPPVR